MGGKPGPAELSIDVVEVCDRFNGNLRRNAASRPVSVRRGDGFQP